VTLAQALHGAEQRLRAADIDDAWLEAEVLLRYALGLDRHSLFARLQQPIEPQQQATYDALLQRRLAHEPTAYIVGRREFFGLELECTPAALIPRPETELLVEETLAIVRSAEIAQRAWEIVDVGTGNGAVAVALAVNLPGARIIGIDVSRQALLLARRNAERHRVADRACLVQSDLLSPLARPVDVVVANLPYVSTADWKASPPEIREHEPRAALDGGPEGTALLERLLAEAPACLGRPGWLLAEIGDEQGERLRRLAAQRFPQADVEVKADLAGLDRLLVIARQASHV
jgi:release factor glutamine methyltransferase